ncbi:MAG: DUF58 domain-containing protein [SAR324 cluster bacterium]|uniref:DUF58 domain-containing protein n=1 Tax=SAR324 cluster bacterium TaxID=2024889 RepID=A0A2A4SVE7_9DELT|nr:MAG: DUF58 domain-containing protein [SAR324 cluster bacterium]
MPEKALLKKVRQIQIRSRRMVNDVMAGEYQSAFKGRGMEFDMVREYHEGDEPRLIDWNVTARMGHPYVRSYVEERELTIMFVVDISASGMFGSVHQAKKEVAAELCAVLAFNAIKNNDKVGLILFSDQVELFVPAKKGRTHVLRVIRELLYFKPQHKKTSIKAALEYFRRMHKKRAVVFLVSDFLDQDFFRSMNIVNKRHDLVAVEIFDPQESELARVGLIELEDPETGVRSLVDTSSRSWRHHYRLQRLRFDETKKAEFRKMKIDHLKIRTDRPFEHDLTNFFKKRGARA